MSAKPDRDPAPLTSLAGALTSLGGARLAGRYRYAGELGAGASSRVIALEDESTKTHCAAKVLDAEAGARAVWEFEALERVRSPHLVRALELLRIEHALPPPFATPEGAWFLIEARAPGKESSAALEDVPHEARAGWLRAVVIGVLAALDTLHVAGLSHGDVKPENVLVEGTHATLIDLGLAEPFGRHPNVSGTLRYLAPEAHEGERSVATDLYALGMALHTWMHGSVVDPIDAPAPPTWAPSELIALARDLVQARPEERPSDARAALARLGVDEARPTLRTIPFVGSREGVEALRNALETRGVAVVVGPPGSGRTRVIEEAARATQERVARAGGDVPTFLRTSTLPWSLTTPTCIHLTTPVDATRLERFVAATRLRGHAPWLAMEHTESLPHTTAITRTPLDAQDIATMLEAARGEMPSAATTQAALRATLGYPGRIVRALPLLVASELDVLRASSWRDATWATRDDHTRSPLTQDFLTLVAALGGSLALDAPDARASEAAREAIREGLATRERDGTLVLRADIAEELRPAKPERAKHAKRAMALGVRGPAASLARWHLGKRSEALRSIAQHAEAHRDDGAPEKAREALERFLRCAPEARDALALALSDACRAEGDFDAALGFVVHAEGHADQALAHAELLRLVGRLSEAESHLADPAIAENPQTHALRARIALAQGDVAQAEAEAELALASAEPLAETRATETLALLALAQHRLDDAEDYAQRGLRAATRIVRASTSRTWMARATSLLAQVHTRRGAIAEGAQLHTESAALAERAGDRLLDATFSFNAGLASLETGQLGDAITLLERAALGLTRLGRDAERGRTIANLANALALVGDEVRATKLIHEAALAAEASQDLAARDLTRIVRADLAMAHGKLRSAKQALEALAHAGPFEAIAWARLAHLHAIQGDLTLAREALSRSEPHDARGKVERSLAAARVALDEGEPAQAKETLAALPSTLDFEMQCRALALRADVHEALREYDERASALTHLRTLVEPALRALPSTLQTLFRQLPHVRRALTEGGARSGGDAARPLRQALEGAARVSARTTWKGALQELTETALRVAAAERAFIVVWSRGRAEVLFRAGAVDEHAKPSTSLVLRTLRERVVTTSDAIASQDASASVHALALRSVLAVRLASRTNEDDGHAHYVLALDDRLRPGAFDPQVVESIRALADICGPVLEARLEAKRLRREVKSQTERVDSLAEENERQRESMRGLGHGDAFAPFVHTTPSTRDLVRNARRLAHSNLSILITGETGTGKSLLARCIHLESERRHAPFVVEEGAAFTSDLLESTLFGHVRGAFTGADRPRKGLFELAHGGTLFLDGIDEAPLAVQAKLLRVLVEGVVRPMGSERERKVDVRIITALRHPTGERIPTRLREDLFYRLAGASLAIEPLRKRSEDLVSLAQTLLASMPITNITNAAMNALVAHPWPGNVRELEHVIAQAKLLATGGTIDVAHLRLPAHEGAASFDLHQLRGTLTRELVLEALQRNGANRTRAARELGISRFGLQKILKRLKDESHDA